LQTDPEKKKMFQKKLQNQYRQRWVKQKRTTAVVTGENGSGKAAKTKL